MPRSSLEIRMPFTLVGPCEYREEIRKSRFITLAAPIASPTVVVAAVLIGEFPRPAVMGGVQVTVLIDEGLGFGGAGDGRCQGNEAALANLFPVFARADEGDRKSV